MLQKTETRYKADKGCFIVRRSDQVIMGEVIDLGSEDAIENYEDQPYTDESYREYYALIGVNLDTPKEAEKPSKKRKKNGA